MKTVFGFIGKSLVKKENNSSVASVNVPKNEETPATTISISSSMSSIPKNDESLHDRSVKINIPRSRRGDPNIEFLFRAVLEPLLIKNIGMKSKIAVLLFTNSKEAVDAAEKLDMQLSTEGFKVKYLGSINEDKAELKGVVVPPPSIMSDVKNTDALMRSERDETEQIFDTLSISSSPIPAVENSNFTESINVVKINSNGWKHASPSGSANQVSLVDSASSSSQRRPSPRIVEVVPSLTAEAVVKQEQAIYENELVLEQEVSSVVVRAPSSVGNEVSVRLEKADDISRVNHPPNDSFILDGIPTAEVASRLPPIDMSPAPQVLSVDKLKNEISTPLSNSLRRQNNIHLATHDFEPALEHAKNLLQKRVSILEAQARVRLRERKEADANFKSCERAFKKHFNDLLLRNATLENEIDVLKGSLKQVKEDASRNEREYSALLLRYSELEGELAILRCPGVVANSQVDTKQSVDSDNKIEATPVFHASEYEESSIVQDEGGNKSEASSSISQSSASIDFSADLTAIKRQLDKLNDANRTFIVQQQQRKLTRLNFSQKNSTSLNSSKLRLWYSMS